MDKIFQMLKEWAINYARHRHIVKGYEKSEDTEKGIIIHSNGKKEEYTAEPVLRVPENTGGEIFIVTLNTKQNLDFLIKSWKSFSSNEKLTLIFANPSSELETKWIVKPYIHNRICDEGSLASGLKSMFDNVGPVNEKELLSGETG